MENYVKDFSNWFNEAKKEIETKAKQQLLESLEEEVKKLETKEYLAGSPEYHRQKALNKVKALIQSKKTELL